MGYRYLMHWESFNVSMFILSILLLLWLYSATSRFLHALKYRAAVIAGNVAVVKGIGSHPDIFSNATPDHLMALRQRRPPVTVADVPTVVVPLSVQGCPTLGRAEVRLRLESATPCMLTVLGGLSVDRLKQSLAMLGERRGGANLPDDNKTILEFFRSAGLADSCGQSVLVRGPVCREISLPPASAAAHPASGDALRSPCVLLVPEKESPRAGDGAVGSIDFALYVTAGAAQPPVSARGPCGAPEGDVSGDVSGDVEIGALGEPAPAAANRAVGAGSLLVASSGRLFNCMEVFGPLQDAPADQGSAKPPGSDECVICLTEPKEVLLVPCRHLSVCRSCFQHVDKCPVCRAPYDQYLTVQRDDSRRRQVSLLAPPQDPQPEEERKSDRA